MFPEESFPASQADSSAAESEFASPFLDEALFAHLDGEDAAPFQEAFTSPYGALFEAAFDPESEELAAESAFEQGSAFENLEPPGGRQSLQDLVNELTNLMFFARHPELKGRKIQPGETKLAKEWLEIRDRSVQPALQQDWPENRLTDLVFFARHPSLKSKPVNSIAPKYGREWLYVRNQQVRPVLVAQAPPTQPQPTPVNRGPVTSRRVYVVNTAIYKALPAATRSAAGAEMNAIWAFAGQTSGQNPITVMLLDPDRFPVGMNFSDSAVSLVDYDPGVHLTSALRVQQRNAEHSIRALGFRLPPGGMTSTRFTSMPDRIGSAAGNKHVVPAGNQRLAIPLLAAAVELEKVLSEIVEEFTEGQDAKAIRNRRKGPVNKTARYWASHQALIDTRMLIDFDTVIANPKDPGKWFQPAQELLGRVIGRALAHEARHLYVSEHAETGLGAESAQLRNPAFARFSSADQREILDAIRGLESQQGNAIVVETFPAARRTQGFPF